VRVQVLLLGSSPLLGSEHLQRYSQAVQVLQLPVHTMRVQQVQPRPVQQMQRGVLV
jgi:hypothetical protein